MAYDVVGDELSGVVHVVGETKSDDFPTSMGAFAERLAGSNKDAFIAKLDPALDPPSQLVYSTYLGGDVDDVALGVALQRNLLSLKATIYVTGWTLSAPDFPVKNELPIGTLGGRDSFLVALDPAGQGDDDLLFSTRLGGPFQDHGHRVAVRREPLGGPPPPGPVRPGTVSAYVVGVTTAGFPTTGGSFQTTYGGGEWDAFVARIDLDPDCNATGVPDAEDIASGTSADVNGNGVPDECEPPPPDFDGDGISDPIDGTFAGGAFVDESGGFSDSFTNEHRGGATVGFFIDRGGLDVSVQEIPGSLGLSLEAAGAGVASVSTCLDGFVVNHTDGDVTSILCGSLTLQVLAGPTELLLGNNVVVTIPAGATVIVSKIGQEQFEIQNSPESGVAIVIQALDQVLDLGPGEGTSVGTNRSPVADAGSNRTVECTGPKGAPVSLVGTGSSDPDGDALIFTWAGPFGPLSGPVVTPILPVGTHSFTLTVDDGHGGTDTDTVVVTVEDITPPRVTTALVPVDVKKKKGTFRVEFSCTDTCDARPAITSATLNGVEVATGQIVELELKSRERIGLRNGILTIAAPSFELSVACEDESGKADMSSAVPEFAPAGPGKKKGRKKKNKKKAEKKKTKKRK